MMIKVQLTTSNDTQEYYLLGAGYGITKPIPRGTIFPHTINEKDSHRLVCICDEKGEIHWAHSNHVRVISIDGVKLHG
jgi:hypothetical protein